MAKSTGASSGTAVATRNPKTAVGKAGQMDVAAELAKYAKRAEAQEKAGGSGNLISFKGGVLTVAGAELAKPELEMIVLDSIFENALYRGKYDPSNAQPPVCYAFGYEGSEHASMKPHPEATDIQAPGCKGCPHNEWGSSDTGNGKACKNVVRLIGIMPGDLSEKSIAEAELYSAKVPVTSVANWSGHMRKIKDLTGLPVFCGFTRVRVRPDPKHQLVVTFEHAGAVDKKYHKAIIARVKEAEKEISRPYPEPTEKVAPAKGKGKATAKKRKF